MFVAIAIRLVKLYIAATSATSQLSSSVIPTRRSDSRSSSVISTGDRVNFSAYRQTALRRAGLDARRSAVCRYAEKLTRSPVEMTEDDLESLRRVGLTDEECWDVAEVAAMYNFTNRMAMATNMLPNEEYHALARS